MKTHTPGPWYTASTGNYQGLVISETTGENVAVTYNGDADAALVASAPELLDALESVVDDLFPDQQRRARAAIAKAKGENP